MSEGSGGQFDVFALQRRALPVLLGWAAGSIAAGLVWWQAGNAWWRGLASQFVGWGLVDGLIALFGLRGAARNAARLASGEMGRAEHDRQARTFERILWINAGLDVGYVLGGRWLARRWPDDAQRRGMGRGIVYQGAFLLVFDLALALLVWRKRRGN